MRPHEMLETARASNVKLDPKNTMIFLKGASTHLVLNGDGSYPQPDPEGRSRTGLWMDYVELLKSIKMTVDGVPLEGLCQWVYWDPTFAAWLYGDRGASAMWFEGDTLNVYFELKGQVGVELSPSMRFMWPEGGKKMRIIGPSHGRDGMRFYGALEAGQSVEVAVSSDSMRFSGWSAVGSGEMLLRISASWAGRRREQQHLEPVAVKTGLEDVDAALALCSSLLIRSHVDSSIGGSWLSSMPVFSWVLGADDLWCSMAANRLGLYRWSREAIGLIAAYQARQGDRKGLMPNEITLDPQVTPDELEMGYASALTTPLWVSALEDYVAWSGDFTVLKEYRANLDMAVEFLTSERHYVSGLFGCDPSSLLIGWPISMSLEREGACVEVNALVAKALEDAASLYSALGDERRAEELHVKASDMAASLSSFYSQEDGLLCDHIDREGKKRAILSAMSVFPLSLGLLPEDAGAAVIKRLYEQDFMTPWGLRSMSSKDPRYDPKQYYMGAVWPELTALYALGCYRYGFHQLGWESLNKVFKLLLSGGPAYVSSAYSGESPDPIGPAWHSASCALALMSFFDGALRASGNGADAPTFEPHLPEGVNQVTLQYGDRKIALRRSG
ncbi:amylo-alpha-1,6-glucosidase [Tardisphaera miroshnichenkoae]